MRPRTPETTETAVSRLEALSEPASACTQARGLRELVQTWSFRVRFVLGAGRLVPLLPFSPSLLFSSYISGPLMLLSLLRLFPSLTISPLLVHFFLSYLSSLLTFFPLFSLLTSFTLLHFLSSHTSRPLTRIPDLPFFSPYLDSHLTFNPSSMTSSPSLFFLPSFLPLTFLPLFHVFPSYVSFPLTTSASLTLHSLSLLLPSYVSFPLTTALLRFF